MLPSAGAIPLFVAVLLFPLLLLELKLVGSVALLVLVFLADWDGRMIVKTLSHELQSQRILLPGGLLNFGSFVLEPDLDLIFVQLQLVGQLLATFLVQVTILGEFVFQTG